HAVDLAHVDRRDDVGVRQPRGDARFALETPLGALRADELGMQHLERDDAVDRDLPRLVDGPRGASPEDAFDAVARNPRLSAPAHRLAIHCLQAWSASFQPMPAAALKASSYTRSRSPLVDRTRFGDGGAVRRRTSR